MDWFVMSLYWIITLLGIGLIFLPLTSLLLPTSRDRGFAVGMTLGLILITYSQYVLGTVKLVPFVRPALVGIVALWAILNGYLYKRYLWHNRSKKIPLFSSIRAWYGSFLKRKLFAVEVVVFASCFLFLAYIRGQEPSIHGLEKFMDFGFINAVLRSAYFPPKDMWYGPDLANPGGYPINYYYFGHMVAAVMIRLTDISSAVGYNLTLAMILGLSAALCFSLGYQFVTFPKKITKRMVMHAGIVGALAAALVNFSGNFHTIYLFTKGYTAEKPVPFWEILSGYNPTAYWYPNATRFIPYTIHEFPSYSYVVADLHGHVFDIPFVLVTITLIYHFFSSVYGVANTHHAIKSPRTKHAASSQFQMLTFPNSYIILFGFLLAVHYMTNAFDGPIYALLLGILLWAFNRDWVAWGKQMVLLTASFLTFSLPFSLFFKPFASGVGINCSDWLLAALGRKEATKLGPLLMEPGKCQHSAWWMLFVLWGFFAISALLFVWTTWHIKRRTLPITRHHLITGIFFAFGFFLILIPEFFYAKDIYPDHFRANTMFKLGYQAYILMSLAAAYTYWQLKDTLKNTILVVLFALITGLPMLYSLYSFKSYYGDLRKAPLLNGIAWLQESHPADYELVQYINSSIKDYAVILEAQGDSYTDYNRISSYTGLPTPAGWWVHEWLWRGSPDIVGVRSPDIQRIYETTDPNEARQLLQKYRVDYVVVSRLEQDKYPSLFEKKFEQIGRLIFRSSDGSGALYQVN